MENKNKLFKVLIIIYILLYAGVCIYGALVPADGNTFEDGASIYFPTPNSTVSGTFSVNGSVYAKGDISEIYLVLEGVETSTLFPISCEQIIHDDKLLETLSTFKTEISLDNGQYDMYIKAYSKTGVSPTYPRRTITVDDTAKISSFKMFSMQHLITLGIITIVFIFIFVFFKEKKSSHVIFAYVCSLLIMVGDVYSRAWLISNGTFRASYDMALHMCDISGVLVPIFLFMNKGKAKDNIYNLMFIWGLGGALMALLTPEMGGYAFPSYYYFNFFIKHSMIVFAVFIATFFHGMRPNIKRIGWVMIVSSIMVAGIYGVDQLVRLIPPFEPGNYMFLSYPPTGGSLIDMLVMIFGPSPYYIIGLVIVGVLIYVLMWLPFYVAKKITDKRKRA